MKGGSGLLELVLELIGREPEARIGRCIVIDGSMDALSLVDEASSRGVEDIVILGAIHTDGRGRGMYTRVVEPRDARAMSPQQLTKELWMNLTGSLGLDDYAAALSLLWSRAFILAECDPGDSEDPEEACKRLAREWIQRECGA
ncbi:hypothetical protein [Pyrodictium abyssi]|uniref:hypothetical protein n=1 Tax=Pyrodictium abyssi TaxID=54256 RepID=UPI0030C6F331